MFNPVYNADGRVSYFRVLCLSVAFGCFICGCMVDNDKKTVQRAQSVTSVQEETQLPTVSRDYKQIRTLALEEFTFDVEYLQTCGTLDRGFDNCVVELSDSLKPYYSLSLDASADGYKIAFVANEDSKDELRSFESDSNGDIRIVDSDGNFDKKALSELKKSNGKFKIVRDTDNHDGQAAPSGLTPMVRNLSKR